jgi:hypothetical protein
MTFFIALFMMLGSTHAAPLSIYGKDDRKDLSEASEFYQKLALSTAAMISQVSINPMGDRAEIYHATLGVEMRLCPKERFRDQISAAACSGFLIGPDLIATAGHCATQEFCRDFKWVFDYHQNQETTILKGMVSLKLPLKQVYGCQEIVSARNGLFKDAAVIRLDRVVSDREPLKISLQKAVVGDPLVMIGHPSGLPTKVTDGARVLKRTKNRLFTNLDAFGGNSGSPVMNAESGEVIGILTRGEQDYFPSLSGCNRSATYGEEIGKEKVSDISQIE